MGRTLTSKVSTAIAQTGTAPRYLVYLNFTTPLYLSTAEQVTWNSQTWVQSVVSVNSIKTGKGGAVTGEIELLNGDNAYGSIVLNEGVRDKAIEIYSLYGDSPYAAGDAEQLVDGVMDAVPEIGDSLRITFTSEGSRTRYAPNISLASFISDGLTSPGEIIEWNGKKYILESRN